MRDRREIALHHLPRGDYALRIGLYNRDTVLRRPSYHSDGAIIAQGEIHLTHVTVP